jgi:topoisomerase-4 subunit A
MSQDFSFRYPLIDGQGNWGSIDDPKSFAAMRYTESRLAKYSDLMLSEIKQGTTQFQSNFDGTLVEPKVLPCMVPNVLLNGAIGIAVGMATDIPPHNMTEVLSATLAMIENPGITTKGLMEHIKAPDYPTGPNIMNDVGDLLGIYESGSGVIKTRAVYESEGDSIIINALPPKVSGEKICEAIGKLMNENKLPFIDSLIDQSDHSSPTRIVITSKKSNKMSHEKIMGHLFSVTDLELSVKVNMNMIGLDGAPRVKPLKEIISEWLSYRRSVVESRLKTRLGKIDSRLHLIEGLILTYLSIDEVIKIIREEDDPKLKLMEVIGLTEVQATYVLDTKLRNLAKIEEIQLKKEQSNLSIERNDIAGTLESKTKMNTLISSELRDIKDAYGDSRRSKLTTFSESLLIDEADLIPPEPITISLSDQGWVRSAKGHSVNLDALSYRAGDSPGLSLLTKNNLPTILFDSGGRSYQIASNNLPSARGYGNHITTLIDPPSGSRFVSMLATQKVSDRLFVASKSGYGFICTLEDIVTRQKKGKAILNCNNDAFPLVPVDESKSHIVLVTSAGRMLIFKLSEIPELKKGKGNKLISGKDVELLATAFLNENDALVINGSEKEERYTPSKWNPYLSSRAKSGKALPRGLGEIIKVSCE